LSAPLRNYAGGAAQPLLTHTILRGIKVDVLTEHATQRRIADILSAYDDLIENNRRRMQLLEQAARLLYQEWFVRLRFPGHEHVKIKDGVPEGWERVPLSQMCTDIRQQVDPTRVAPDTPYIGLEHIPRRSITLQEWGSASDVESSKFMFTAGDILFGKIRPYFHKVVFTLTDGIASSDAIVIRPVGNWLYEYVLFLISSDEFVALASKTVREGSKMPRADWKFLSSFSFLCPPKDVAFAFLETTSSIVSQLRVLALQNRQLAKARDLLLPRLMNGELSV
jgi:type I restriction enzyme S subunit